VNGFCDTRDSHHLDAEYAVRQAISADIPRIGEIWMQGVAQAFGSSPKQVPSAEAVTRQFAKLLLQQDENFKFWLCVDPEGKIAGWCTVQPFDTTPLDSVRAGFGFISTYMDPLYQGRGLGRKLSTFVVEYCWRHTEIAHILGLQDRNNRPSVRIMDDLGFANLGNFAANKRLDAFAVIVASCPTSLPLEEAESNESENRL
jgi:L-amino acid N-acyltransferase YncA